MVEYPGLLGEQFAVVGYPLETVLAEKIVTMLDWGELTTRERDFADVYLLANRLDVDGDSLSRSIDATISHRGSTRQPLRVAVGDLARLRQSNWSIYVAAAGLADEVPSSFEQTIDLVATFADPVLACEMGAVTWDAGRVAGRDGGAEWLARPAMALPVFRFTDLSR